MRRKWHLDNSLIPDVVAQAFEQRPALSATAILLAPVLLLFLRMVRTSVSAVQRLPASHPEQSARMLY
jgi:hypothetical protein